MKLILKGKLILLALVAVTLLAACGSTEPTATPTSGSGSDTTGMADMPGMAASPTGTVVKTEKGQYTNISPDQLHAMLEHKDFFLVDVHIPHQGLLPDLDARIPYNEIAQNLDKLPQDKNAEIVLTCRSGNMSSQAATTLANLGYTNVFSMVGGFDAWEAKGYPFTKEP